MRTREHLTSKEKKLLYSMPFFQDCQNITLKTVKPYTDYIIEIIDKGEVYINQGDTCNHIYIFLTGKISFYSSLNRNVDEIVKILSFEETKAFGCAQVYSTGIFPYSVIADKRSSILKIEKEKFLDFLMTYKPALLYFFNEMNYYSYHMQKQLKAKNMKTVRDKFITFLKSNRGVENGVVKLKFNILELANYLGVSRPALSKEISKLAKEGYIVVEKKVITINSFPDK